MPSVCVVCVCCVILVVVFMVDNMASRIVVAIIVVV